MKPLTIAFFGISGAGKGTQAALLEKHLQERDSSHGVLRPEMGVLVRSFSQSGTSLADRANTIQSTGGLLPSFIPIHLLTAFLNEHFTGEEHMLLDGTCRSVAQSEAVDDMMRFWGRENLTIMVIELSPESAYKRLTLRGRGDDAEEAMKKRFAWYKDHVVPAYEVLERRGWKKLSIDGEPDVETIHKNILSVLGLPQ